MELVEKRNEYKCKDHEFNVVAESSTTTQPLGLVVTAQAPRQRLTQDIAKGIGEEALMRDKPRTLSTTVLDRGGDMFHVNITAQIQPWRNPYQQYSKKK